VLPMTQANDQIHPSTPGPWIPESQSPLVLQNREIQGLGSLANHPSGSLSHFESFNSAAGTEVQNDSEFRMSRPVSSRMILDTGQGVHLHSLLSLRLNVLNGLPSATSQISTKTGRRCMKS
jgi:hypothetical protein